jgi:hypothetical protein
MMCPKLQVARNKVSGVSGTSGKLTYRPTTGSICLDEVVESFDLFKLDQNQKLQMREEYLKLELDPAIVRQVRLYVQEISMRYHAANPL